MNYVKSIQDSSMSTDNHSGDVEIVQLTTSVKESLQFPEIEKISDSSKNSETEEVNKNNKSYNLKNTYIF
jgi:hypothetical protein